MPSETPKRPRIIVTGASGFIGQRLVPALQRLGDVLLVGRDPDALRKQFGDAAAVCNYDALGETAKGYDVLVHLAVRNNDQSGDIDAFRAANVTLLQKVIDMARFARVGKFIHMASLQAQADARSMTPYSLSKREAETYLESVTDLNIVTLKIAAVYDHDAYRGKLAMLHRLPRGLRRLGLGTLACVKPTTHISRLVDAVENAIVEPDLLSRTVTDRQMGNGVYRALSRVLDLSFALFILIFFWWLLALVWIAVKTTSPGPGIFAQERIGKEGRPFTCYKFRTMHVGTKQAGTHEVTAAANTTIGVFLRKTKIDELPQIFNILFNQLRLVGPRPCLPVQTDLIEARRRAGVLDVKGGITGLSQIRGIDMREPDILAEADAEYLALRTFLLDIKIILATARGKGQGDRVSTESSASS